MTELTSDKAFLPRADEGAVSATRRESTFAAGKELILLHWLAIVVVAVIATRVMWAPALLWGHSAWFDLIRMVEFHAAMRGGDYFPAWSPDLYSGYGSPLFQFYAPLVYYLTEIPLLAGADLASAIKITQLLTLVGSGLAMYQLASANVSRWAACFGAILYMVAPYRMVDLFVRHAFAEHAAFLWLPLVALGTQRFVETRAGKAALLAIFASAGLLLTHNLMALIGLPVCVLTGWFLARRPNEWKKIALAATPASIGCGLAAFFWLPAFTGRVFTKAQESLTSGHFDYRQHFVSASELLSLRWSLGESSASGAAQIPAQIGIVHLLVLVTAAALFAGKGGARSRWNFAAVGLALAALCMCHAGSRSIWEALPLLEFVQFPWRFLALVVFGTAMCGAMVADRIISAKPQLSVPVFILGLAAVIAANFPYFSGAQFVAADRATHSILNVSAEQLASPVVQEGLGSFDKIVTPTTMRNAHESATSSDDFLPRDVRMKPASAALEMIATDAGFVTHSDRVATNRYRATVSMRASGRVALHQFWFPGWSAMVDGNPVAVSASGESAIVSCDVPAGDHVIEFDYSAMPLRGVAFIISATSALAGVALVSLGRLPFRFLKGGTP